MSIKIICKIYVHLLDLSISILNMKKGKKNYIDMFEFDMFEF